MATKFLGKVVAGAAVGGASLLIAPGIAIADGGYGTDGQIFTHPKGAKAGHEVTIIEICPEPQKHAWVWSKVTGKLDLKPKGGADGEKYGSEETYGSKEAYGSQDETGNGSYDKQKPPTESGKPDKKHEEEDKVWKGPKTPSGENSAGRGASDMEPDAGDSWEKQGDNSQKPEKGTDRKEEQSGKKDDKSGGKNGYEEGGASDGHGAESSDGESKKWVYATTVTIPWGTKPGRHEVKGSCAEGVLYVAPKGWIDGGDGGTTGTDPALAAGGAGMLGAAALGGILLLRRRRTDGSAA